MISLFNKTRLSLPNWNQAIPFDSFVRPLLKKQPVYLQHFRVVFAIYVLVFWLVFPSQGDITAKKCSLQKLSCLIAKTENLSSLGEHLLFPPHKMLANVSPSTRKKSIIVIFIYSIPWPCRQSQCLFLKYYQSCHVHLQKSNVLF